MQLTRFTDNSLRTLIYLALNPNKIITINEISEKCAIPRNHLVKVVHSLAKANFIQTSRGRAGGIKLIEDAKEVIIGDVVRVMEGQLDVINCFTPLCPIAPTCKLRNVLSEATNAFISVLDNYSIKDLIQNEQPLRKLLNIK